MLHNLTLFCGKCWDGPRACLFRLVAARAWTLCAVRTSIGRNKPRSKNDPSGNELAARARAFSLPSLRQELRADLNKGLRVVQEMQDWGKRRVEMMAEDTNGLRPTSRHSPLPAFGRATTGLSLGACPAVWSAHRQIPQCASLSPRQGPQQSN